MVLSWRLGLPANVVSSVPEQDAEFLQGPWDTDWIQQSFLIPSTIHPSHAQPLPPPTSAETTGNILPETEMRRKSKNLPWDVTKKGQQTVHYQVIKCTGAF